MDKVLTEHQRTALRRALAGRLVVLCFGAGVDSTGLMVALRAAGLRPDLVSMADVSDEKPQTWQHVERMGEFLHAWGWPPVTVCRKVVDGDFRVRRDKRATFLNPGRRPA